MLVAIFALMSGSAWAYSFMVDGIYYNITDANNLTVEVTNIGSYGTYTTSVVIPATVTNPNDNQTYTVTAIGNNAFCGCTSLTSVNGTGTVNVTIPTSVTSIKDNAFLGCSGLTELTLPANLTSIGQSAFQGCSGLENIYFYAANCSFSQFNVWSGCTHACTVTIGDGVAGLPNNAFYELTGLNSIVWGEHTALTIGDYAFFGCMGLTTLTVPEFVTSIGYGTFAHLDNLTRVNYNATNCAVNEYAWYASNVYIDRNTHLEIGNNVTHLSGRPFAHFTDLTTVTIGTGVVSMDGWTFYYSDHIETVNYNATNCTTVAEDIWNYCNALRTVNIGDNVTHIGKVFYRTDITTVNFGEHPSLEVIRNDAFRYCDLTSLTIPNSVTTIGETAFMDNSKIETLTIGSGVTSIGESAFRNLSKLETLNWNVANAENNLTIGGYCWYGTNTHPQTLVIGDNVLNLPNGAFDGFTGLTSITIGSSLSTLPERAFRNCSSLTSITIPANITTIGSQAFYGCSGLTSITIPSTVTSIGNNAFAYCNGLTSVEFNANCTTYGSQVWYRTNNPEPASCTLTIGNNVTALPDDAFNHFYGLTSITFSTSMTGISGGAFNSCINLTEVVIPNTFTSIGDHAFAFCSGMTSLTIGTGVNYIGKWAFHDCNHLATVNYNATNCTSIGDQVQNTYEFSGAGNNCTLTIGNNVTSIPAHLFQGFTGLNTLVFEAGSHLGSIREGTFYNCHNLTSVTMPSSVTSIESSAFNGCTGLTSLDLGSVQTIGWNAFYGCTGLTKLTIPASITLIGGSYEQNTHGAFTNCTNLEEIWYEGPTPPNVVTPAFYGVTQTIPVYVPRECGYPTTGAWAYFSNYIPYSRFDGGSGETGAQWGVASNWAFGIPQYNEAALINATAIIPGAYTVNVDHIAFTGSNYMIIENAGQLSCNSIAAPDNIYVNIRDGGQLVCNTEANATLERSIVAHGENGDDGWYFIASPAKTAIGPSVANGLLSNEYDLYRYYEDDYTWHNYKVTTFPLSNSWGYLYANNTNNTLHFGGTMLAANAEVTVENLDYASPYAPLRGFNLMGNPFTHNLTVGDITLDGTTLTTYYMVENGKEIVVASLSETPIKPGRGFMVQATAAGQDLVFNPSAKGNAPKVGYISITAGNGIFTDKAFVQVGGGNTLRKLTMGDDTPKVYVQQGGADYAAATVEATNNVVLIGFEAAENGTYTIAVDIKDVETNYLHLVDNMTGAEIDLLSTPSYTFNAKTMDYASRFKLVFNANSAFENENGDNETFAYFNGSEWVVNASNDATIQIVDMMGRVIRSLDVARNVSTNGMTPGIYVLRLIQGNNVKTQKIVVE